MKTKTVIAALAVMLLMALTAMAADVTGKWTAQVPGRGGNTREMTFDLKASGDTLTGTISGAQGQPAEISNGKVSGDDISFTVKRETPNGTMVQNYKGKVSGSEIKFSVQREGSDQPPREFTAKKAS